MALVMLGSLTGPRKASFELLSNECKVQLGLVQMGIMGPCTIVSDSNLATDPSTVEMGPALGWLCFFFRIFFLSFSCGAAHLIT